jgi:hypothetical protein
MSSGSQPLDQSVTVALLKCAEEFESAVLDGQVFFVAVAAQALVQNLRRFLPKELSHFSSLAADSDSSFALSLPTALYPNPDPEFSETVRASVRRFKESISQGNRPAALEALLSTGIITAPSPQGELERLEMEAARASGTRRLLLLPKMAKLALWMGDADKAERYASEILRLTMRPRSGRLDCEEAIHDGNMVLGLLALRRGDKEGAKEHLLASVHTDGSLEMAMIGPNLTLANELLRAGEREVVLEYLEMCRTFWSGGRKVLERWISQIRRGEDPAFDLLYFSS